jgi:hypothetical protein
MHATGVRRIYGWSCHVIELIINAPVPLAEEQTFDAIDVRYPLRRQGFELSADPPLILFLR